MARSPRLAGGAQGPVFWAASPPFLRRPLVADVQSVEETRGRSSAAPPGKRVPARGARAESL